MVVTPHVCVVVWCNWHYARERPDMENAFRVASAVWGESSGHRWLPLTNPPVTGGGFISQRASNEGFGVFLNLVETNYWETPWDSLHWNGSESIWHRLPCLINDTHIVRLRKDPCSGTSLESSLHNDCWWPGAYLATGHLQISSWCKPSGTHQGYPDVIQRNVTWLKDYRRPSLPYLKRPIHPKNYVHCPHLDCFAVDCIGRNYPPFSVISPAPMCSCDCPSAEWRNPHYDGVIMSAMASLFTSLKIVCSAVYSGADQRKHQSSASLAFVRGFHRDRWIPHTKGQWRGKCFHLMTSSCFSVTSTAPGRSYDCSSAEWRNPAALMWVNNYKQPLTNDNIATIKQSTIYPVYI